jgi:hypothetical protein
MSCYVMLLCYVMSCYVALFYETQLSSVSASCKEVVKWKMAVFWVGKLLPDYTALQRRMGQNEQNLN